MASHGRSVRSFAMSFSWDFHALADHLKAVVSAAEAELRLEQAVYGLDARDERSLQALIAERLGQWYSVAREVHYPSSRGNRLTHRMRCDLVLTPPGRPLRLDPTKAAVDEVARAEARAIRELERLERAAAKERAKRERLAARAAAKAAREAEKEAKRLAKLAKLAKKAGAAGPMLFGGEEEAAAAADLPSGEPATTGVAHVAANGIEASEPRPVSQACFPTLPRSTGGGGEEMTVPPPLNENVADTVNPPDFAEPGEALWLEVKVAYQFREGGVRHGGYGAQWRQAVVTDLRKMEAEPLIHGAGLVLVVFNESDAVLNKDLELFEDVLARKEVLAGFRQVRTVPIQDRVGHASCTVAVWPTVQR